MFHNICILLNHISTSFKFQLQKLNLQQSLNHLFNDIDILFLTFSLRYYKKCKKK